MLQLTGLLSVVCQIGESAALLLARDADRRDVRPGHAGPASADYPAEVERTDTEWWLPR